MRRILLVLSTILSLGSCTANTVVNNSSVTDTISKKDIRSDSISIQNQTIAEITGNWYPIFYMESAGQALISDDIDSFMNMFAFVSEDTIVIFGYTFFDLQYSIDTINTNEYLRRSVDEPYKFEMLDSQMSYVFARCSTYSAQNGNSFASTVGFAYDGKYILLIVDGVAFLCERQKTPTILTGSGSVVKEYLLKGQERELKLSYEFFSEPDELIVYDQLKRVLYKSGMQSTKQAVSVSIALDGVEKLVFKINAKSSQSQWRYEYSFK